MEMGTRQEPRGENRQGKVTPEIVSGEHEVSRLSQDWTEEQSEWLIWVRSCNR